MTITSELFLFVFLFLSLGIYYLTPKRAREYTLMIINFAFYALLSKRLFLVFFVAVCVDVFLGFFLSKTKKTWKNILLIAGISFNIALLGYFKYVNFFLETVNHLWNTSIYLRNIVMPIGISFFTFKAVSYLVDIYRNEVIPSKNPVHAIVYLSFFAQIQSGPISRYSEMDRKEGMTKAELWNLFSDGVYRFLIGFGKKVLIANVLANITKEVYGKPFNELSTAYIWLGAVSYSLQLFFDFAGYSDMAIGLTEMFGYKCKENFDYPYMTESVSRFWRRWHISLGNWFRDYVYIPMGGSRSAKRYKVYLNLLVVWILTGIWHGASWNFVIWGLGYFIWISFERMTGFPDKIRFRAGRVIYRIAILLFINFQWVMFRANGLLNGLEYIKRMFLCPANHEADVRTLFLCFLFDCGRIAVFPDCTVAQQKDRKK